MLHEGEGTGLLILAGLFAGDVYALWCLVCYLKDRRMRNGERSEMDEE